MSGGWIVLGLVLAYLVHTYFFWKKGRGAAPTMGSDVVDNPDTPGSNNRTVPAGLSHLMWPTGRHPRLWKKGDIAPEEHR